MYQRIFDLIPFIAEKLAKQASACRIITNSGYTECLYTSPDGRHCAVGHLLTENMAKKVGGFIGDINDLLRVFPGALEDVLPNVTPAEVTALLKIQEYHDAGGYEKDMELSRYKEELEDNIRRGLTMIVNHLATLHNSTK